MQNSIAGKQLQVTESAKIKARKLAPSELKHAWRRVATFRRGRQITRKLTTNFPKRFSSLISNRQGGVIVDFFFEGVSVVTF